MIRLQNFFKLGKYASPLYRNAKYFSDALVTHRQTADNNESTPFDFTNENWQKVDEILARYPTNYKKSACIPL